MFQRRLEGGRECLSPRELRHFVGGPPPVAARCGTAIAALVVTAGAVVSCKVPADAVFSGPRSLTVLSRCRLVFTMRRILIVESDLAASGAISRTLAGLGYGLDIAYDADQARSLARQNRYAITLIDERLSDGDGVKLYEDLHRVQQDMAGVLVSAVANLYTVAKAIGAGMARVLSKPVDFQELLAFIDGQSGPTPRSEEPRLMNSTCDVDVREEAIAELSPRDISQRLTDADLIQIIRTVDYPFVGKDRLEYFDRDTLERVVHLVRRWCRNRLQRGVCAW
jgi:ActR/RegA family two-component response regulator